MPGCVAEAVTPGMGSHFEIKISSADDDTRMEYNRLPDPLELLQVLSNILTLVPENRRKLACDIALTTTKNKRKNAEN